jgi:hypothetical protein
VLALVGTPGLLHGADDERRALGRPGPRRRPRRLEREDELQVISSLIVSSSDAYASGAGAQEREQLEPVAALVEVEVGDQHGRLVARGLHELAPVRVEMNDEP